MLPRLNLDSDVMDDFNEGDVAIPLGDFEPEQDFSTEEFIPPPPPTGWRGLWSRTRSVVGAGIRATGRGIKYVASAGLDKIKEGLTFAREKPISTGIAITAASVNGLNALTTPADISPEDIGSKWWREMSNFNRVYSLATAFSAFGINTIMNSRFLPQAIQKLKNSLADMRKGCSKILVNVSSIGLGLGAGVAQSSIAYSAYLWLPLGTVTAAPIALLAGIVTFSGRYLSVKNIINRIINLFSRNVRLQHTYAELIDHINPFYLDELQLQFQTILARLFDDRSPDDPLTNEEYEELLQEFAKVLHDFQSVHPDLILGTTTTEYIAKYAGLLADVTIAVLCSTSGFMTFDQKGFDGVNTIAKFAKNPLDSLNAGWRGLIGASPGLASFMFFGNHAIDIRKSATELIIHLYHNPGSIPNAVTLLAMNGIGATSMKSVGQGIVRNANNIFSLSKNAFGSFYISMITLAGAVGNGNTIIKAMTAKPEPKRRELKIEHLSKRIHNADDHPISEETASVLRRNSIFPSARSVTRRNTPVQVDNIPTSTNPFDRDFAL